jgi:hypothetical protein
MYSKGLYYARKRNLPNDGMCRHDKLGIACVRSTEQLAFRLNEHETILLQLEPVHLTRTHPFLDHCNRNQSLH